MRKDCALSKLTEEQKADLFDWLTTDTYDVVLKRVAQPPPQGFGIKTHINSLYRFYQQRQAQIRAEDLVNLSATRRSSGSPLPMGEESEGRGRVTPEFLSKSEICNSQSAIENPQSFFTAASA